MNHNHEVDHWGNPVRCELCPKNCPVFAEVYLKTMPPVKLPWMYTLIFGATTLAWFICTLKVVFTNVTLWLFLPATILLFVSLFGSFVVSEHYTSKARQAYLDQAPTNWTRGGLPVVDNDSQ